MPPQPPQYPRARVDAIRSPKPAPQQSGRPRARSLSPARPASRNRQRATIQPGRDDGGRTEGVADAGGAQAHLRQEQLRRVDAEQNRHLNSDDKNQEKSDRQKSGGKATGARCVRGPSTWRRQRFAARLKLENGTKSRFFLKDGKRGVFGKQASGASQNFRPTASTVSTTMRGSSGGRQHRKIRSRHRRCRRGRWTMRLRRSFRTPSNGFGLLP